jgi:hypothetical protein
MKKVWNVYMYQDGVKIEAEPNSEGDISMQGQDRGYTFLYQVTEEGELPKKEVEKVVELKVFSGTPRTVSVLLPDNAYEPKLHYKIKE